MKRKTIRQSERQSERQEKPPEQSQTKLVHLQLQQALLEWACENRVDHFATKLLLEQLTSEPFYRAHSAQRTSSSSGGFTVIYDEVEVGVGWHVYYLRSTAKDEVLALEEFRRQFFENCKPRQWVWLLPAITVHIGVFVPEYIKVFAAPPKVVVLHWPDTPY